MSSSLRESFCDPQLDRKLIAFYSYKGGVGRTMALCNVACGIGRDHARRKTKDFRLLCLDLDLEAPGVHAFLRPAKGVSVRGFLGLLVDTAPGPGPADYSESDLKAAVSKRLSSYAYPLPENEMIWVMPAGSIDPAERNRALDVFRGWLSKARDLEDPDEARSAVPFLKSLRQFLREQFTYVLIDSRTGAADEAFATTALLAEAMVFLFRPNENQIFGVGDALVRFLYQQGLTKASRHIPVIPVLSPRPSHSDDRLERYRELARKNTFKWLVSESQDDSISAPSWIELPFDSQVEIGDQTLIPPSPFTKPADARAPLFEAYSNLTTEVAMINAANDPLGAGAIEVRFRNQKKVAEAFRYLQMRIALEPDRVGHWTDVYAGYSDALKKDSLVRDMCWRLCLRVEDDPALGDTPKFFASLWLSEAFEGVALELSAHRVAELWRMAAQSSDIEIVGAALTRVVRLWASHPDLARTLPVPKYGSAVKGAALLRLNVHGPQKWLGSPGLVASRYYSAAPEEHEKGLQLWKDVLSGRRDADARAQIAVELGKIGVKLGRLSEAFAYFEAGARLPGAINASRELIQLAVQICNRPQAESLIEKYLPVFERSFYGLLLEHRLGSTETVAAKLRELRADRPDFAAKPFHIATSLLLHGRFQEAVNHMLRAAEGSSFDIGDNMRLALAKWLATGESPGREIASLAFAEISKRDGSIPLVDMSGVELALAFNPIGLQEEAAMRLAEPQWPVARLAWCILASITAEGYQKYSPEVLEAAHRNPLLMKYMRRDETFQLLDIVWKCHREGGTSGTGGFDGFGELLRELRSIELPDGPEEIRFEFPDPIADDRDERLPAIRDFWTAEFERSLEGTEVGQLVNKVLAKRAATQQEEPGDTALVSFTL